MFFGFFLIVAEVVQKNKITVMVVNTCVRSVVSVKITFVSSLFQMFGVLFFPEYVRLPFYEEISPMMVSNALV